MSALTGTMLSTLSNLTRKHVNTSNVYRGLRELGYSTWVYLNVAHLFMKVGVYLSTPKESTIPPIGLSGTPSVQLA